MFQSLARGVVVCVENIPEVSRDVDTVATSFPDLITSSHEHTQVHHLEIADPLSVSSINSMRYAKLKEIKILGSGALL